MTRPAVEAKCLLRSSRSLRSGSWLGWRIRCIVLQTSFGRSEKSAVIINDRLAFLITFLSLFRVCLNMSYAHSLGGRACASRRSFARSTCREGILGSFSQGAGGRVTNETEEVIFQCRSIWLFFLYCCKQAKQNKVKGGLKLFTRTEINVLFLKKTCIKNK